MGRVLSCLSSVFLLIIKFVFWLEGWYCGLWKFDWLVWDFLIFRAFQSQGLGCNWGLRGQRVWEDVYKRGIGDLYR